MYSVALCIIFNWTFRECSILITILPISLSRGLLSFLSFLKFLSPSKAGLHFFFPSGLSWCNVFFGEGNGTPLQYSCLENPWTEEPGRLQSTGSLRVGHDWATSLSLFYFHALEKEMATNSGVLAWRIPGTGKPSGLLSMGSHRVGHDWSDLAAAAAVCSWLSKYP